MRFAVARACDVLMISRYASPIEIIGCWKSNPSRNAGGMPAGSRLTSSALCCLASALAGGPVGGRGADDGTTGRTFAGSGFCWG